MKIQVQVNTKYTLSVTARERGRIEVTECQADLAANNLFLHPFSPRRGSHDVHQLTPLGDKAAQAFRALSFIDSPSPFVTALTRYYSERFPHVIDVAQRPLKFDRQRLAEKLELIRDSPDRGAKVLRSVVTSIDRTDSSFFSVEKMLGTFEWLRTADPEILPFAIVCDSKHHAPEELVYLTPQRDRALFNIPTQTAYVPEDAVPDPAATLEALAVSGACDHSVRFLNRAAAVQIIVNDYAQEIGWALRVANYPPALRGLNPRSMRLPGLGYTKTLLSSAGAAALGLSGFADPVVGANGSIALILAAIAVGGTAVVSDIASTATYRPNPPPSPAERAAARRILDSGRPLVQSALSVLLLRFLDGLGSASDQTPIVPSLDQLWQREFTGTIGLDPRIIPQTTHSSENGIHTVSYRRATPELRAHGEAGTDTIDSNLARRIHNKLASQYTCLEHSAVADTYWNTLMAIQTATSFASWAGLAKSVSVNALYLDLLRNAQQLTCNGDGRFVPIDDAFAAVLHGCNLATDDQDRHEIWGFCAQPLLFINHLERSYAQRQAQQIALRAVLGD
jgi:hypothetical protein